MNDMMASHGAPPTGSPVASAAGRPPVDREALAGALRALLGPRFMTEASDVEPYLVDWRRRYFGRAIGVARPQSADEAAQVVRLCVAHGAPVVPQGGNTGLSGGATPDDQGDAVVVSLRRMNRIRAVDPVNDTVTVEAGVLLAEVQRAAADAGRLFPLSLAAEGSCTVGGNLATNAGGVQVLRYGNARELCLGLEVVTPTGEVWDGLRGLRKDNTGYDLRDLFIGAEGTLGLITAATLKMFPRPAAQVTALAAVGSPRDGVELLARAKAALGPTLTAFELFSPLCLSLVLKHFPTEQAPFGEPHPQYVLLECSDAESEAHARERFETLLADAIDAGLVRDAAVAASVAQSRALWRLRELISEAQAHEGKNIKHDVALPISEIANFVEATDRLLADRFPGVRMVTFGHLGDGNLHYNVSPPEGAAPGSADQDAFLALQPAINEVVHDSVVAHRGSISAEHGLGQLRRDENRRYKSSVEMGMMRAIKSALDPKGLFNPGKVL